MTPWKRPGFNDSPSEFCFQWSKPPGVETNVFTLNPALSSSGRLVASFLKNTTFRMLYLGKMYTIQVDDMVDMYEDARSKYEAVLEHMKERICDR